MSPEIQDRLMTVLDYLYEEEKHYDGTENHIWYTMSILWDWLGMGSVAELKSEDEDA